MSEYQYYEFVALDRVLTKPEMAELRGISTRARITTREFVNEYHWGDLKADPKKLLERYFDAFLYVSNWGSRWVMFRFPKCGHLLDSIRPFLADEAVSGWASGDHLILSPRLEEEGGNDWFEPQGILADLIPVRTALLEGDLRGLYLAWLSEAQTGNLHENRLEPSVPDGLQDLDPSLEQLADFLLLDQDLLQTAAEVSQKDVSRKLTRTEIDPWLESVPVSDKDAILRELLVGGNHQKTLMAFQERALQALRPDAGKAGPGARTVGELLQQAEARRTERLRREAAAAAQAKAQKAREDAAKRQRYLESLSGREDDLWKTVVQLVLERKEKTYVEAANVLADLRDLAELTGQRTEFSDRLALFADKHAAKKNFQAELRKRGLPGCS